MRKRCLMVTRYLLRICRIDFHNDIDAFDTKRIVLGMDPSIFLLIIVLGEDAFMFQDAVYRIKTMTLCSYLMRW